MGLIMGHYFYVDKKHCFYLTHTDVNLNIPLSKDVGVHQITKKSMESIVNHLNETDSPIIFELYDELVERGFLR